MKILSLLSVLFLLVACSGEPERDYTEQNKELKSQLVLEPKILKYQIVDDRLWITLEDDGTNRHGYTSYVCQLVNDTDSKNIRYVIAVAAGTATSTSLGDKIGRCDCETYKEY